MWPNLHSPFNFLITISVDSLITKVWKCLVFSNTKNFQICNGNSVINAGCVCFYSRLLNLNSFYRLPLTCFLSFDFVFLITSIFSLITVFICLFTFCMCCCYCKSIVWWRRLKRKKIFLLNDLEHAILMFFLFFDFLHFYLLLFDYVFILAFCF